jgi:very-short-patch-repair endonuclease
VFDRKVAMIASHQHGLVSRDQVLGLRGTPDMIRHRVRIGRWRAVHQTVYAMAGVPETEEYSLMAACLASGDGAAVSHRSAVEVWSQRPVQPPGEITAPRETGRFSGPVTIHRSRDLAPEHVTRHARLPVTTPARTLVDLGQVAPVWEVSRTLESFLTRKLVTVAIVRAAVVVHGRHGRRGVGVLRRVLDVRGLGDMPAESVLEAALANLCRDAGLPMPQFQYELDVGGRRRRIDFAYPDRKLAIEVDGYEFHSSKPQFEADRLRSNELTFAGWHVLRFTWDQVIHRPNYVVATIQRVWRKLGV